MTSWTGLMVPSATPKNIIQRIHAEVVSALKHPDMIARVQDQGFQIVANSPEDAHAFMAAEVERWGKVIRDANVRPD